MDACHNYNCIIAKIFCADMFYISWNWVTRLEGNPLCSKFKGAYCSNKKKKNTLTIVIVPVVLVSILVVMCILWKLYCKGKTKPYTLKFPLSMRW
jgi:hypothetical protein